MLCLVTNKHVYEYLGWARAEHTGRLIVFSEENKFDEHAKEDNNDKSTA